MTEQCGYGSLREPVPDPRFSNIAPQHYNALSIMRCYFASHSQNNSCAWESGMDVAVAAFGRSQGPTVAYACMDTVRAMRKSRANVFHFKNPFCKCCQHQLTQHEGYLLDGVEAAAKRDKGKLRVAAMLLCEGNNDDDFVRSIWDLNNALFATAEHQKIALNA